MANNFAEEPGAEEELFSWLETFDFDTSLAELIDDHPEWMEPLTFEPEELERFEDLAHTYAQELSDHGLLIDLPHLELDEPLLEPPHETELDIDLDH